MEQEHDTNPGELRKQINDALMKKEGNKSYEEFLDYIYSTVELRRMMRLETSPKDVIETCFTFAGRGRYDSIQPAQVKEELLEFYYFLLSFDIYLLSRCKLSARIYVKSPNINFCVIIVKLDCHHL